MRERFIEDLNRRLLLSNAMEKEEELIVFNSLVKKYNKLLSNGKNKNSDEELDECLDKVIKSLPKYVKYFENSDYDKLLIEYKSRLPEGVILNENNIISSIGQLVDKTVLMQAELGKFSKNSGINVVNDKTNYTNNISDFEIASQKFTPEFIKQTISKMGNVSPEMLESYKQKYEYLCKSLAENAIKDKVDYYERTVDYLVDFYSDNEIARKEESQLA